MPNKHNETKSDDCDRWWMRCSAGYGPCSRWAGVRLSPFPWVAEEMAGEALRVEASGKLTLSYRCEDRAGDEVTWKGLSGVPSASAAEGRGTEQGRGVTAHNGTDEFKGMSRVRRGDDASLCPKRPGRQTTSCVRSGSGPPTVYHVCLQDCK
ncbi:hypothetical protein SKAU_G00052070 [Synaphobranchus kaupii]|uniref:Uncharacterized protein n=1 Tax=Synaphobranchus kaupii TaxID=118154 RepID=A0A9Q1J9W3_SYNKA|nr:hypothetical protein SKAU_G00052070 [Synaphobranchus kaupii]